MDDPAICRPVPSQANGATRLRRVEGGRKHVVKVLLNDAEYNEISNRAEALKLSIQRFLVSRALAPRNPANQPQTPRMSAPLMAELAAIRRLTANLANNINQIARALNSGARPDASISPAMDVVRRVMFRLDSVLSVLAPDPSGARPPAPPASRGAFPPPIQQGRIIPEAPS